MPPYVDFNFDALLRTAVQRQRTSPTANPRPIDDAADFPAHATLNDGPNDGARSPFNEGYAHAAFGEYGTRATFDWGDEPAALGEGETHAALNEDETRAVFNEDDVRAVFDKGGVPAAFPTTDPRPIDGAIDSLAHATSNDVPKDDAHSPFNEDYARAVFGEDGTHIPFNQGDEPAVLGEGATRATFDEDDACTTLDKGDTPAAFNVPQEVNAPDGLDAGDDGSDYEMGYGPSSTTCAPPPPVSTTFPHGAAPRSNPHPPPPASAKEWKVRRNKKRAKEKKARQRDTRTLGACPEQRAFLVRHLAAQEPHEADFSAADMPHASTGYQGPQGSSGAKHLWTVQECVEKWGHVVKQWDGKTPIPILDRLGRIFGICAGSPEVDDWNTVSQAAAADIQTARGECSFPKGSSVHRRAASSPWQQVCPSAAGHPAQATFYTRRRTRVRSASSLAHGPSAASQLLHQVSLTPSQSRTTC